MQAGGKDGRNSFVMGSLSDIRISIQRARAKLAASLEPEALRAGADAAALVENRIVTTGATAEGGRLSPYSTKEVAAFRYLGRSRNNAGETAIRRKAKAKQPVSYKEFRQLNGLNTANKNLEFTGEMWQGFGVTDVRTISTGLIRVTIGGKNQRSASLLGYHSEREKTDVTEPSRAETEKVKAALFARLEKVFANV